MSDAFSYKNSKSGAFLCVCVCFTAKIVQSLCCVLKYCFLYNLLLKKKSLFSAGIKTKSSGLSSFFHLIQHLLLTALHTVKHPSCLTEDASHVLCFESMFWIPISAAVTTCSPQHLLLIGKWLHWLFFPCILALTVLTKMFAKEPLRI